MSDSYDTWLADAVEAARDVARDDAPTAREGAATRARIHASLEARRGTSKRRLTLIAAALASLFGSTAFAYYSGWRPFSPNTTSTSVSSTLPSHPDPHPHPRSNEPRIADLGEPPPAESSLPPPEIPTPPPLPSSLTTPSAASPAPTSLPTTASQIPTPTPTAASRIPTPTPTAANPTPPPPSPTPIPTMASRIPTPTPTAANPLPTTASRIPTLTAAGPTPPPPAASPTSTSSTSSTSTNLSSTGASHTDEAPRAAVPDAELAAYQEAHAAHFRGTDAAAALAAWDRYLARFPDGKLAPEARYDRAIALVKLARWTDARAALAPFASAPAGSYRQREATQLLDAIRGR